MKFVKVLSRFSDTLQVCICEYSFRHSLVFCCCRKKCLFIYYSICECVCVYGGDGGKRAIGILPLAKL